MRIVADTNTVVSGLLWQGPPRSLIDACREQKLTRVTSPELLAELSEVLARDKFAARILRAGLSAPQQIAHQLGMREQQSQADARLT